MVHSKEIRRLAKKVKEKVYEDGELEYKLDKANPKKLVQVENKATEEKKEKKKAAYTGPDDPYKGTTDSFKVTLDPIGDGNTRIALIDASGKEIKEAIEDRDTVENIFYQLLKDAKYGIHKIK